MNLTIFRYIVCKWKRADAGPIYDYMFYLNQHMEELDSVLSDTTIITSVPLSVLQHDTEFYDYIVQSNEEIGNLQVCFKYRLLRLLS